MQDTHETTDAATPLISVIIPLEFHRDRWERCLQEWQAQSLAPSKYELVLVTPPNFADRAGLDAAMAQPGPICRLVVSDRRHDMGLCADGAAHSRGQFLFFTESHCWPEPDVLTLCLRAFDEHSDWAGLSGRSQRVASSRMAVAEAEMYEADIAYGMTLHPWRKILDQCFVTRREAYSQSGGFDPSLGHFAEWVLAANYHELGLSIGYLPEARFHHQYTGQLAELRQFTRDFLRGEVRYLNDSTSDPGWHLIEKPADWINQGNLDKRLARQLLKQALQDALRNDGPSRRSQLKTAKRWFVPAIVGDRKSLLKASVAEKIGYAHLRFANRFRSSRKLNDTFRTYFAKVIHRQRLSLIAQARNERQQASADAEQCDIFAHPRRPLFDRADRGHGVSMERAGDNRANQSARGAAHDPHQLRAGLCVANHQGAAIPSQWAAGTRYRHPPRNLPGRHQDPRRHRRFVHALLDVQSLRCRKRPPHARPTDRQDRSAQHP